MGEHRDEGFGDKVKDALGMDHDTATTDDREDREGGWAGVGQMMDERDSVTGTTGTPGTPGTADATDLDADVDVANRPAGPDYGADDRPDASSWTRGEAASGESPIDGDEEHDRSI